MAAPVLRGRPGVQRHGSGLDQRLGVEDLAADRAGQLAEVFAFLDVPAAPVEAALRKQRTRPLEEVVANWDDVVDAVEPWRWVS